MCCFKVWDIRMMQDRDDTSKAPDPLQTLLHEKAVNNAEVIFVILRLIIPEFSVFGFRELP